MANALINLARRVPSTNPKIRGARAHVLLLLADHADARGLTYFSAQRIASDAGLTEKTVRTAFDVLEKEGLIVAVERTVGRATRWQVMLSEDRALAANAAPTPATYAGVEAEELRNVVPGTPVIHAKDHGNPRQEPRKSTTETPVIPSDITLSNPQKNPKGNPERGARERRGSRLPADWKPSASESAFARDRDLDPDHIAECFRDYWHARADAGAVKIDWSAAWRLWCRRERQDGPGQRTTSRRSARVDTAQWLAGLRPEADAMPDARVLIDPEGNPQ